MPRPRIVYRPDDVQSVPTEAQGLGLTVTLSQGGKRDSERLGLIDSSGSRYPSIANTQSINPDETSWPPLPFPKD